MYVYSIFIKIIKIKTIELKKDEDELFFEIMEEYGQFSAIKLMNMTHNESPWKTVFNTSPQGVITFELLRDYFKTQIVE